MVVTKRKVEELKEVCMEPDKVNEREISYYVIHSEGRNITILNPLMLGAEYNKTYGHYHVPHYPETYILLNGEGAVLMQRLKNLNDYFGEVEEVILQRLEKGKETEIPKGFGHILINLGSELLIVKDNWSNQNAKHTYEPIKQKRGFGYYILKDKSGNIEFVKNKNYVDLPPLKLKGF